MSQLSSLPSTKFSPFGFGEYLLPEGKTFDQMQTAAKIQHMALAVFGGILAVGSVCLIPISVPLGVIAVCGLSFFRIRKILDLIGISNRSPPTNELFPPETIERLPKLGEVARLPCRGFPTKNGPDSQKWKEELIRSARHSIILSGCYCGDEVFDRTLDLMVERMRVLPDLVISILTSDALLSTENNNHLEEISREFPNRFTCLRTPEMFPFLSPTTRELSITSNHTKALVIDYGAYFLVGGSGITEAFTNQEGLSEPADPKPKTRFLAQAIDFFFQMRAFRDMDFIFHSELGGAGTRLYVEMMKLFERMRFRESSEMNRPNVNWPERLETTSSLFEETVFGNKDLRVACYVSGPETIENNFLDEVVEQVCLAEKSIVIDHLYFHPTERLLNALIDASNRGVKITILTNKNSSKSPRSHSFYTERSNFYMRRLFEGRTKENIELFEFAVPFTSLHKKVFIRDEEVSLVGSSNLGKKSLSNLDYEINIKVESPLFAESVLKSVEEDKTVCERVSDSAAPLIPLGIKIGACAQAIPMIFA